MTKFFSNINHFNLYFRLMFPPTLKTYASLMLENGLHQLAQLKVSLIQWLGKNNAIHLS